MTDPINLNNFLNNAIGFENFFHRFHRLPNINAGFPHYNIKKFQDDPRCRFMVGTPSTGGYGITLTAATTVIYYSNGYDLEKRLQSEDRAHRIGQQKSVTYVDLICNETVDEKIVEALRKKINIASEVLGEELKSWI